jgi:hypothetical protein
LCGFQLLPGNQCGAVGVAGSPVDAEQTFKPKRISYAYDEVRRSAAKAKRDVKIDWRAPERLFDEPDELVAWARAALAAAGRVAARRERTAPRRKSKSR